MEENIPQLNELVNPNKWDDRNWMKVHMDLESYSIDKHCFSKEKEFAYRKGWEWTQTLFGLHVLGAMTPNARALGVGAGREPVLFYLADRIESVTGIDLYGNRQWSSSGGKEADENLLKDVSKYCPRHFDISKLSLLVMDGTKLNFNNGAFDFTWSLSSIEHFGGHENARKSIQEMARVTKSGGIVVVATEFIITPGIKDHPEYFTREMFEKYVLNASRALFPVQAMNYDLPSLEYLNDPIMVNLGNDVHRIRHHIILNDGTYQWTSAICFFRKIKGTAHISVPASTARIGTESLNQPRNIEFREKCSEEDIYYCFRLLLGRNPGKKEWGAHKTHIGNDLRNVVPIYLTSREFKDRKLGVLSNTENVLIDLEAFKMCVSASDIAVGKDILINKNYEPHVTEAIKKKLAPGMFFIDIGANIGYFSLLASHLVGKEGRVFSFEPFQYNIKLLYLNARINGFENIEIYPFAVADRKSLFAYDNTGSNGVISELDDDINILSTTLVYSVRIDDVLQDIDRMDVIKIDVEGAEYMALNGGRSLLKKHRPTIFSEFCPPRLEVVSKVSAENYLQLLLVDENYSISVLDSKSGNMIDCKNDINKVIKCFETDTDSGHIDIVAYPVND